MFVALTIFLWGKLRISLGLNDLSRTPSGTFFREVHPGSEMAIAKMTKTRQNENENFQTMTNRGDS